MGIEDDTTEGTGGDLEGSCTAMCPDRERDMRARAGDIDSFERSKEGAPPDFAVKRFARNMRLCYGSVDMTPKIMVLKRIFQKFNR